MTSREQIGDATRGGLRGREAGGLLGVVIVVVVDSSVRSPSVDTEGSVFDHTS